MDKNLSLGRTAKLGLFHLGSGMADVLATGTWNRIMITDLGFSATPISLLLSLRYFLAPLGVWAGRMSDRHSVGGYRRLFWIWLGRAMMVLSILAMGISTAAIAQQGGADPGLWLAITLALLLFSLGTALSGSTFLALIYDRAPEHQRGRAVGLVWTFLLLGFTIGGIFFGLMLRSTEGAGLGYTPETLQTLFVVTALMLGSLWFFSVLGEERRGEAPAAADEAGEFHRSMWQDLRLVWQERPTRFFLFYLALSMFFAFAQDAILEPFAGEVFGMDARVTTRFAGYWGTMAILGSLLFIWLSRRYKALNNTLMSLIGVAALIATFAVFGLSALAELRWLVTPGLLLLGLGLGLWNIGTLGLMMDMSPAASAGTFLGFWSLVVTFGRGFGVSSGGIIRDLMLNLSGSAQIAYGSIFVLECVGMLVAYYTLRQIKLRTSEEAADTATLLAGSLD